MLRAFILAAAMAAASTVQAQGTVKIAILGPMSFVQGENHWAGAEMARDEINKAGGINVGGKKMQLELIRADTNEIQSVPDATNATERVITRDKADFLIGGFRSEAVIAMQEIAMDHKKLFLGAGAAHSKLGLNVEQNYERYKYWFRVTPTKDVDLVRTLFAVLGSVAQQIRTDLKKEQPKIAIVSEKAVWTEALVAAAQKNLPAMKMEVVGTWQPSAVATDVTAELSPDALRQIVRPFADPSVGCVSSEDRVDAGGGGGLAHVAVVLAEQIDEVLALERNDAALARGRQVAPLAEQDYQVPGVLPVVIGVRADHLAQLRHRIGGAAGGCLRALQKDCHRALADAVEQLLLVAHVVVDAGLGHFRVPRELAQAGSGKTVGRKQLRGSTPDAVPPCLARHRCLCAQQH